MKMEQWERIIIIIAVVIAILIVGFVVCVICLMGGYDNTVYPSDKALHWICEDPYFEIYFSDNQFEETQAYIEWNGEKIQVYLGLHASYFDVFLQTDKNEPLNERVLFRGTWKYKGDTLVVSIDKDNIFDGAYTELVFYPQ